MAAISERARQFEQFVNRSIIYPLVLLIIFAAIISWRVLVLVAAARAVDYSDKVIAQANSTLILAVDEQSGQRGYFVDGDKKFLERYDAAAAAIGPSFSTLAQMVAESREQRQRVALMEGQYAQWQTESTYEMNVFAAYPGSYRTYFDQGREKFLMDALRQQFATFISSENKLRIERAETTESATGATLVWSAALAIFFGLCLSVVWIRQTRQFADQYEEALSVSQRNLSLLSATLMSIGDGVLVTDARGKVVQMNTLAEELTGWKFSDAYGMNADSVFKTVDRVTGSSLESPIKRAASEGRPISVSNQAILIRQDGATLPIDDSCSPIRNDSGKIVGVVLVFRDVTERKRAEQELARLYEREHRIAENLQRSLLSKADPRLFPKLDVETLYQPAWAEAKVGGDYFDIISLNDGRAGLVVGDVSGKGLKAASRTAEMKFTFRAYLRETGDVADSVSRLNKFVCRTLSLTDDPSAFFLCLTAIVLNPTDGRGTVCVCGAEPPLIIRSDGAIEEIPASGTPIGVFESSEFAAVGILLNPGDMISIATDGITEARHGHEFLGNEGLGKLASEARLHKSLSDVAAQIVNEVKAFAENQLADDVCLLVARRK